MPKSKKTHLFDFHELHGYVILEVVEQNVEWDTAGLPTTGHWTERIEWDRAGGRCKCFPPRGNFPITGAAGGKWSVQAQDSVVHDATTADVYVSDSTYSHTLPRIHIRMDSRTQEKRRQSDSDERIPACQENYPALPSGYMREFICAHSGPNIVRFPD